MGIERRKLLTVATVGLVSTSWKASLHTGWIPKTNSISPHPGGYGSISTDTDFESVSDDPSTDDSYPTLPEILTGTGTITQTETETGHTIKVKSETATETGSSNSTAPETVTPEEPDSVSPLSGNSNDNRESAGRLDSDSPSQPELPDSGYGIDVYGHPLE